MATARAKSHPWQKHGPLALLAGELEHLNRRLNGVFVTINQTDGSGRRKAENIVRARAVWHDHDTGGPLPNFPLQPTMQVATSPGKFHSYWVLAAGEKLELKDASQILAALVQDFGSDKNVKDLSRVLRLPGFHHMKGEAYRVRLMKEGPKYSAAELLRAFPATALPKGKIKIKSAEQRSLPPSKADDADVLSALHAVPPGILRADWVKVGMALHSHFNGGEVGFAAYLSWSAGGKNKFKDAADCRTRWDSFSKKPDDEGISAGTLFYFAKQNGWRKPNMSTSGFDITDASIDWPYRRENGAPDAMRVENVRALLDHLGVQVYEDIFAQKSRLVSGHVDAPLDDARLRKLWSDAPRVGLRITPENLLAFALVIGNEKPRHPVREYLSAVEWDGRRRIDTWLKDYCGAEDTDLNRSFGRCWLLAAVRRVMDPGCKVDAALILEGSQGAGKSSVAAILGGKWHTDDFQIGSDSRSLVEKTRGRWIVELSELSGMSGREIETVKAQLSRTEDTCRAAYARLEDSTPRQFVFIGTTNSTQYLKDETGGRRFWPVRVGKINLEALKSDRDQIWAEAAWLAASGVPHSLPPEHWSAATEAQKQRTIESPTLELLREELERSPRDAITSAQARAMVGMTLADPRNTALNRELARALQSLGYTQFQKRIDGKQTRCYVRRPA